MSGSIKNDCIICVPHCTGIGTEIRENPVKNETKVVVNMPQGLGRYEPEDAAVLPSSVTFEWYLKNHLGSTMLVYASGYGTPGVVRAAYDYRSFGEQIELTPPSTGKVTENFTGKERDDETELDYFGARYLDPMLGMWISVDPARQFASPYLYAGNGVNPVNGVDPDGNQYQNAKKARQYWNKANEYNSRLEESINNLDENNIEEVYNNLGAHHQAVAATGRYAAGAAVEMEANAIPGGSAAKPIVGTIKRSVKEEINEEKTETGSTIQSVKNVIGGVVNGIKDAWNAFWKPCEGESIIHEDQK